GPAARHQSRPPGRPRGHPDRARERAGAPAPALRRARGAAARGRERPGDRRGDAARRVALVRALIVDDEPLARRELRRLLDIHGDVEVIGEAGGAVEAERAVTSLGPDLLFLDIQMPRRTGLQFLESLEEAPQVIFTTAHDEHALRAFELGALDYLLKPIAPARLATALERVRQRLSTPGGEMLSMTRPLLVRDGNDAWLVTLADVSVIEAAGNYVQLHFAVRPGDRRPLLLHSLSALERRLDPDHFFRASRRVIVNLDHIERFETGVRLELIAHLRGGQTVPFSRRQSVEFRRTRGL